MTTSPPSTPTTLGRRLASVVAAELVGYVASWFRVPMLFCSLALVGLLVVMLQDAHPHLAGMILAPVAPLLPESIHLRFPDFVRLATYGSLALYLLRLPFRRWSSATPVRPIGRRLLMAGLVCTAGWGLAMALVPTARMAPGTSRASMVGVFAGFYAIHLLAFAGSIALASVAERIEATATP